VQVSDANGCTANSDTLFVLSTDVDAPEVNGRLAVWPVPATDAVQLQLPEDLGADALIMLVDGRGRVVRYQRAPAIGTVTLDLQGLASGPYRLRLTDGASSWTAAVQVR
jgi:hypothetical protein